MAAVRLQCLATLAREFADHPATGEALLAASEDPDAEVRLRAAIALGPKGREVLLAVAGGEGAEDATTERAVLALGFYLTTAEAQGILRNALRTRREATARACLRALGQRRGPGVVATLAKVVAVEKPELAAVAADALGATGDAAARQAIAEIQSRARRGPRQLSLAGGESGQLSLASGEEGRLSLAEDERRNPRAPRGGE